MARIPTLKARVPTRSGFTVPPPPKVADSIYATPEYRAWRDAVVSRAQGRCQDPRCAAPFRRGIRLFADHVIELRDGGAPFDLSNGLARCGSCHTRKTADERAKRMKA